MVTNGNPASGRRGGLRFTDALWRVVAAGTVRSDTARYAMLPPERAAHRTASAILKRISLRTCSTYSLVRIHGFIHSAHPPPALRHARHNAL